MVAGLPPRISDQSLERYSLGGTDHNSEKYVVFVLRTFEGLLVVARDLPLQCWGLEVHILALAWLAGSEAWSLQTVDSHIADPAWPWMALDLSC